jgi:hypothetical protein
MHDRSGLKPGTDDLMTTEFTVIDNTKARETKSISPLSRGRTNAIRQFCSASIVKAYKLAGFIILSVILVGMGAYLSASGFIF